MQTRWETAAVLGLALLLTACGGGGGGGGGSSNSGTSGNGSSSSSSSSPSSSPSTSGGNTSASKPSTPQTTPTASYRVQLAWTAPGTRANGTPLPLSELSGYRVYYLLDGADPSSDSSVSVAGGSTTSLSLTLSEAGTYTFAITAIDQNGLESSLSTPVSVPIN
jgi:hypothetical protein